ncbi:FHA domain-containing protein [Candidatus Laterigemmans baculatus]|uniref:FHA domain-containing protein n=1 Tax=Candidatus Laterigemmans baculatus TaxID=2770505 RepID=UPI0013D8FE62|nr:FHA domain-containing protein [Candidatus Laterigemmans baculatus]
MQVFLKVVTGSHAGKEIAIASEKFLIGRGDDCQLRPKSDSISRRHCVLAVRDGRVLVQDLKSRNGTIVNDKRLPPDRAKVLKPGDILKVGKLEFEIVIKVPIGGPKKPQVRDVKDAATRTVEGATDSRFEDVDISSWLDEADQIDRVRKTSDPDTRQLKLDETHGGQATSDQPSSDSQEIALDEDSKDEPSSGGFKRPEKRPVGKLPKRKPTADTADSRQAADAALKRFFGGRG